MEEVNFNDTQDQFKKNLEEKHYSQAREKIDLNLGVITMKIKEIENFFFKMRTKKDNSQIIEDSDKFIVSSVNLFTETFTLLNLYNKHNFSNRSEKIENIQIIIKYDKQINELKAKLDDITNKIKRQDLELIESARQSKIGSFDKKKLSNKKDSNIFNVEFMKGVELIDPIENTEKRLGIINKEREKLDRISRLTSEGIQKEKSKAFDDHLFINNESIKRYLTNEKPEYYFERIGLELKTDRKKYFIIGVAAIFLIFFMYLLS